MGYQLPRAVVAGAVGAVLAAACGGGDGGSDPPAVLDNAREQVATATTELPPSDVASSEVAPTSDPVELPAPDPSTFEGANRVVNLWVGADGDSIDVDVWGRRTFTNGPILLANGISFGVASDYFSAPPGYSLVIVGAGAGPDADELAGMFNAADGEQITTMFTNSDTLGGVSAPALFEVGSSQAPEPPAVGMGLVVLFAPNTGSFGDELIAAIGGDAFYVGDGSTECRTQRQAAEGVADVILGGTQQVELELEPGAALISLHPWFSPDDCNQPSALDLTVDVVADETTMVFVYSPDGVSIDTLVVPVG